MSGISPTSKPVQPNYTTDDGATYPVKLDAAINAQARLGWAFAPHAQDTPNMSVRLEAGAILSGVTLTEVATQSTATITAPVTNPRIDRVVIDRSTGAVSVVAGSEGASPSAPAIPSGKLPVARVLLTVGMTAITNADITDERVGGGSVAIGSIASPSTTEVASTQDVADALADIPTADIKARQNAMFNAFLTQLHLGRASGAVPSGYMHLFLSDELATKTNATYDAGGDYYGNPAGVGSKYSLTSGMVTSAGGIGSFNASQMIDGSTSSGTGGYVQGSAAAGSGYKLDLGSAADLAKLRIYRCSASAPYGWVVKYSDNGTDYTACTSATTLGADAWTEFTWDSVGAHRYWAFVTTLTADGANQWVPEIEVYSRLTSGDMTLIPTAITAPESVTSVAIGILHKAVDAVTLNTDLKVRFSADNGAHWTGFLTLTELCPFDSDYKLLWASGAVADAGTSAKWEITTLNTKSQRIKAVEMGFN